ncbi:hypothetical protein DQL45_07840 [Cereibacter sphaeroides 2.4.1]|nr:hypothetical protein DQL45_07840 [Cereibacter sphaeroides 2.4.1]
MGSRGTGGGGPWPAGERGAVCPPAAPGGAAPPEDICARLKIRNAAGPATPGRGRGSRRDRSCRSASGRRA